MKKVWAVLLAAALLLALAVPVIADRIVTKGDCGENLTWDIDLYEYPLILTISGTGEMYDWKRTDDWIRRWEGWDTHFQTVDIKTGVTSIGNWAFGACENLTSINIPDSVTRIGDYALGFCRSLQTINVSEDNPNYKVVEGVLFNSDATVLLQYPAGTTATGYTMPDTVTSIGSGAFYSCGNLENISVSNENQNFTVLDGVLYNRDATTLLCYPAGKTAAEYTIPDGVTSIGDGAFSGCSSLTSVTIPNSVTSIGYVAFYYCSSLTNVTISNSVTSIGFEAFYGCSKLTDAYFIGTENQWNAIHIGYDNAPLLNATLHFLGSAPDSPIGPAVISETGDDPEARVLLSAPEDSGMTVYGAYYAADGRFLGLTRVTVPANTNAMTPFPFADGTSLRIFATDERTDAPLCDSVTVFRPGET